ncbi:MAG: acyl-CoA dehydrogenase family protein [Burkholderia contaminans]|uniref:Acyl-CoA dehydrogenase family protein n=1 Tax=Burkholderia contaminans TaxID=488447 RepID=A0AAP4R2F2_9BURK|nr:MULTISPECIES: acyl-CoA dehydrogenase family protein [Burkholderia]MBD1410389.1 acyl-CoA dehydrogenase family protein [Burkholderia contaminans]MBH9666141.1 acyl-CoA dehydrogenase family protein [Burkholderia contaminans]MBH9674309.1 acyl-CoA dehydrogenase family protein [Burkholderia contaminans]MBH9704355.1 acyl-CoA dehydrogenase family protein [Burkholderia contaminans]MBH9719186.1 acyl-CoA dehydrogenase family protein [Burkholderia contaminans]
MHRDNDSNALAATLIARAEALAPTLAGRAAQADAQGRIPAETIADMQAAGFFKVLQPKRYGGYELDPQAFFDIQMALARGCMSTAWVYGVVGVHNWQLALFDERAQQDVWGNDPATLIASTYMPVGRVTPVDGGFRLSGHWKFSSGSELCEWVFLGALVPAAVAGQPPEYRTFLLPKSDYRIQQDWDVLGLRATGSHDIVVDDVFVSAYRTHKAIDGMMGTSPGLAVNDAPLFRLPFAQIFVRAVCTSCIGALQGALDDFTGYAATRVSANSGAKTTDDPGAQNACANTAVAIDEMQVLLKRNFAELMASVTGGPAVSIERRVHFRYQSAQVAERCAQAANALLRYAGGNGIYHRNPLVRRFLDLHAARAHYANNVDRFGQNLGAVMLGRENTDFFI